MLKLILSLQNSKSYIHYIYERCEILFISGTTDDSISANDFVRKRNAMLLIFVATFLTITSTSTVHGPAAVDAVSTKHQQKQHSTSSIKLSSADRSITIPQGLPISGSTRPGRSNPIRFFLVLYIYI